MSTDPDVPLDVPAPTRDVTQTLDATTFDMSAFIAGHRPTRTAVLIPEKASLLADIKKLEWRIDHAPADADVDDLIGQFETLIGEYQSAQRFWTIEARSPEWVKQRHLEFEQANGIKKAKDGSYLSEQDAAGVLSDQLIGQLVGVESTDGVPSDLPTLKGVLELYDDNAVLWNLLVQEMHRVNVAVPQSEAVLTRDFSQRSSAGRNGSAS
jgi:hypothetical protein